MMTKIQKLACFKCVNENLPFALIAFPGTSEFTFFCSDSVDAQSPQSCESISIFPFGSSKQKKGIMLRRTYSEQQVLDGISPLAVFPTINPSDKGTDRGDYISAVKSIVDILCDSGGKTVFSKVTALHSANDPLSVAERLFEAHNDTFRYIYYTEETGLWIGATPELIAKQNFEMASLESMALAGTRPSGSTAPWDSKNIKEHQYVLDHIVQTFVQFGMEVEISPQFTVEYGKVEHLAHTILSKNSTVDISMLTHAIAPTPAICGYPIDDAICQIEKYESLPRNNYGGEIIVRTSDRYESYLNLRCIHASFDKERSDWLYNIHTGGGIIASSNPESEWAEATAKSESLIEAIRQY